MLKDPSAKPAEARPVQPKSAQSRSAQPKSAELKSAELKSAEPKSAEPKPAEPKSAEPKGSAAQIAKRETRPTAASVVAKSAVRRPAREMDDLERLIQQRAYELWESEGRPEGREQAHWQLAEREILGRTAGGRA